ncbi:alpha-(1,3)-fucosyltransferase C-like [Haliotis rufescens]|uniref:alpha-(1,3)-fucosyltransferase C-like n=1 Tax=Haliotis rufescens TaxID=6454 RepID=UPI001EB08193|nr:alpha-(1,3)-fucosyltransferase C-like [Haliotis rufescens]XP_046343487.1 alpha-(1,3)-fucosyltransferase C-like [Haliotis rufescens]
MRRKYYLLGTFVIIMIIIAFMKRKPTDRREWDPHYLISKPRKGGGPYVRHFHGNIRRGAVPQVSILLWTPWFKDVNWAANFSTIFDMCDYKCHLTKDKTRLRESQAVLFHAQDLDILPLHRLSNQVWIFHTREAPPNAADNFDKYANIFNWTSTYRRDSEVYSSYGGTFRREFPNRGVKNFASTKSLGVAWVASNCNDQAKRANLVRELRKFIHVDTFGDCGEMNLKADKTDQVLKHYKFYLAFENSYCRDYITEKFWSSLHRHQIPIVSGGGDYTRVAPPHSFINVLEYQSTEELAEYIKYLDQNDQAYNEYLEWTGEYYVKKLNLDSVLCDICTSLHIDMRTSQVYTNLQGYMEDDICGR